MRTVNARATNQPPPDEACLVPPSPLSLSHSQREYFFADILDAAPKDDLASMEHPLFALRAGDRRVRTYRRDTATVTIKPGVDGCATIHDKDLWIYCISQLVEAMNRGQKNISRTVRFTAYNFLTTTNRPTAGIGYHRMGDALKRLKGTVIETSIETDGKRDRSGFGLIDAWRVIERDQGNRMACIEVILPEWLWRSVSSKRILTLNRDYFRLRKPLDRRIYEIARKHCGQQPKWRVTVATLHAKSGSTDTLRKFRATLKILVSTNGLPDYHLAFDAGADMVTFYARSKNGRKVQPTDLLRLIKGKHSPKQLR